MPSGNYGKSSLVLPSRQSGLALLMLAFIIVIVGSGMLVSALSKSNPQIARDEKTVQALAEAKTALLSWAVNNPDVPGMMPFPDRNTINGDGNFDGRSDCASVTFQYSFLIGQLPWREAESGACSGLGAGVGGKELKDGSGEHLWYAVSRNLVHDYPNHEDPIINPGILVNSFIDYPYQRQSGTTPYPWLTVLDKQGNVISDRVAVVIIAPGEPLTGQDRSGTAPDPSEYLDSFHIGSAVYSNAGYATADEDFVMGEDWRGITSSNTTYQQPYYFNDKLVYITIDELMAEVVKRAAGEARYALNRYKTTNGAFPYAAALGTTTYTAVNGSYKGMLPTNSTSNTTCPFRSQPSSSPKSYGTCSFSLIANVAFKRSSSSWSTASGACTISPSSSSTCNCTGAGSCLSSSGSQNFTCDSAGYCSSSTSGTFYYTVASGVTINTAKSPCNTSGKCTTTSTKTGSMSLGAITDLLIWSDWFTTNDWVDYFYYHWSTTPNLQAGTRTNIDALVIGTGLPITGTAKGSAQSTPSSNVNDYLDTTENTDSDNVYEAVNTVRTSKYNDQVFIVSP